jgi:hypothetical protein
MRTRVALTRMKVHLDQMYLAFFTFVELLTLFFLVYLMIWQRLYITEEQITEILRGELEKL